MKRATVRVLFAATVGPAVAFAAESTAAIEQGADLYKQYCESCHGRDMVTTSTLVFDLRKFPKSETARFRSSVQNGKGGMPAWRDTLSDEDVANLWAYVKSDGNEPPR